MDFPRLGDPDCVHPKKELHDPGYLIVCKRCGAVKTSVGGWRRRES